MNRPLFSRRDFAKTVGGSLAAAAISAPYLHAAQGARHDQPEPAGAIRINFNENPYGPSPKALAALDTCGGVAARYPDTSYFALSDELARKHGVKRENIALGCGSTSCRISNSEAERNLFWAGRKAAFPAVGRISPDYYCMDGTIPRAKLPLVLKRMKEMSAKYGLGVANVFHAGDGNLHPLILYDANKEGELDRAEAFGADILKLCVEVGGVLTGEHGVGVEKRDLMPTMFSEIDLAAQERVKCAFDPKGLLNPGKMFPTLHRCAELGRMHISGGKLPFPDIPRF